MAALRFFLFALMLLLPISGFGQAENPYAFEQEVLKAKIAAQIEMRFREGISRRLSPDYFTITARLSSALSFANDVCSPSPLVPVNLLLRAGVRSSGLRPSSTDNLELPGMSLAANLRGELGLEYKQSFETWLQGLASREFGPVGTVTVGLLKMPVAQTGQPSQDTQEFETDGELATLGIVFIGALIFAGATIALRSKSIAKLRMEAAPEKSRVEIDAPSAASFSDQSFRELQGRVNLAALAGDQKLDLALELWLDEGVDGKRKIAATIDSILTGVFADSGKLSFKEDGKAEPEVFCPVPFRIKSDLPLFAACRSFGALVPLDAKGEILSRAFSELQSIKVRRNESPVVSRVATTVPAMSELYFVGDETPVAEAEPSTPDSIEAPGETARQLAQ